MVTMPFALSVKTNQKYQLSHNQWNVLFLAQNQHVWVIFGGKLSTNSKVLLAFQENCGSAAEVLTQRKDKRYAWRVLGTGYDLFPIGNILIKLLGRHKAPNHCLPNLVSFTKFLVLEIKQYRYAYNFLNSAQSFPLRGHRLHIESFPNLFMIENLENHGVVMRLLI